MRRLSKPRSPRDVSPPGQPRRSLQTAERDFLAALPAAADPSGFARSTFNSLEKSKLRAVLYVEQGSLCVYCERRVAEGHPAPRIDHWRPLGQTKQPPAEAGGFALRTESPDTRRLNDASQGSTLNSGAGSGSK